MIHWLIYSKQAGKMSSLQSAKFLKHIASYSEGEILTVVSSMGKNEQKTLHKMTEYLVDSLDQVDTTPVKKKAKKNKRASNKEIFAGVVEKIETKLTEYETSDRVDEWTINFAVGVNYEGLGIDEIKRVHDELLKSSLYLDKARLLAFNERGKIYDRLKYSEQWTGRWKELCAELDICHQTAKRYIDFYWITNAYPRLLICEVTFETIMLFYQQLLDHLDGHQDLSMRLKQPMRHTIIRADMEIKPEKLPHGGDPPTRSLSNDPDWNAAWEISDEILHKKSCPKPTHGESDEALEDSDHEQVFDKLGKMNLDQVEGKNCVYDRKRKM
jgi:hypothetical protein